MINIRDAGGGDAAFIFATWLRSLYFGSSFFRRIDKDTYFDKYKLVVSALLAMATIKIACLSEDQDVVVGYAVYEGPVLHWVYVKKNWRKQGVARLLVPDNINTFSHFTNVGWTARRLEWKFNPFL